MKKVLFLLCLSFVLVSGYSFIQAETDAISGSTYMAETRGPENGTLLVIGGAASNIFYEKFMDLVGGADAPIVVIPTAVTSDPLTADDLENFKNSFTNRGFLNVICTSYPGSG